jgi:hypothetical protein
MTASKPKRRKPRPTTPYVWNETRDEFKPEDVQSLVDALLRNYLSTEPSKGKATEARKFEIAEQTIDLFWRLFDMLGYWAQAQIVGKVWAEANPKLANQLAELWSIADGIEFDSHVLERFGSEFGQSRGWIGEPIFDFLASREDLDEQTQLSQPVLREAMRRLLCSDPRRSSFWRRPLAEGLKALNFGQIVEPLEPVRSRRRADFFETLALKSEALCRMNFLIGKGIKKHIALEKVAGVLNQSPETLRSWEKLLRDDEEHQADAHAARIAGKFEEEVRTRSVDELVDKYGDEGFQNIPYWQRAKYQMGRAQHYPLERIRDELNEICAAKSAVSRPRSKIPKMR